MCLIANPNLTPDTVGAYELIALDGTDTEFAVTAGENGTIWFIVSTDAGYEASTTLHFGTITVVLVSRWRNPMLIEYSS